MKTENNNVEEPLNKEEYLEVLNTEKPEEIDVNTVGEEKENDSNKLIEEKDENMPKEYFEIEYPSNGQLINNIDPSYFDFNCFTKFFFHWAFKILRLSKNFKLNYSYLKTPYTTDKIKFFAKKLDNIWDNLGYKNLPKNALFKTVIKSNLCDLIIVISISVIQVIIDFLTLIITKAYIDHFTKIEKNESEGLPLWLLGLFLLINQICSSFLNLHSQIIQTNFGNNAGFELNCFIYDKILSYAPSGFTQLANHGEIINFIQIDSMKLTSLANFIPNAVVAPLLLIGYTIFLFSFFGLSFLAGLFVLLLSLIINFKIAKSFKQRTYDLMMKKDACMKITTEIFENIKILKLFNWENEFKKKILEARKLEMDLLDKKNDALNLIIITNFFTPILISIATIGFYQIFNDEFDIGPMRIGLSLFEKLQRPTQYSTFVIVSIMEAIVSLNRIEKFIKQPDINKEIIHQKEYNPNGEYAIKTIGGNFSWGIKQKQKLKSDISDKKDNLIMENKINSELSIIEINDYSNNHISQNNDIINDYL